MKIDWVFVRYITIGIVAGILVFNGIGGNVWRLEEPPYLFLTGLSALGGFFGWMFGYIAYDSKDDNYDY